jgi:MtN3 and saliva related transmembrane protein
MDWIRIIGFIAAFCTTISFLPQAIRTIKTKDTSGISKRMYSLFTLGVLLWLIFGIYTTNWPIIIANAITLILSSVILMVKLKAG